ncbi:MAG: hypothetical protein J6S75_06420, partial [Thermoguttaceae bacterium]|nr:hypothetical protein [Thermoguttaceae bacterium]
MPRHTLTGLLLFAALGLFALPRLWSASSLVTLKDGRVLSGAVAQIESVAFDPNAKRGRDEVPHERIVVIDDTLRQTYVGKTFVLDIQPDDIGASLEVFKFHQPTGHAHQPLVSIGAFRASAVDFDEFGRRIVEMGGIPVVQGITEISPRAIHAEGISEGIDMRISPHNFRRETLTRLIKRGINPKSLDDRLRIYQFYVQAELFDEAAEEMEEIINDFRDDKENSDRLAVGLRMIRQLAADRLISELEMRRLAGQNRNVRALLTAF